MSSFYIIDSGRRGADITPKNDKGGSSTKCLFWVAPTTLVLEVVLILMFNAITEYQLHDEGMQKMRPYRKLSLIYMFCFYCDFINMMLKNNCFLFSLWVLISGALYHDRNSPHQSAWCWLVFPQSPCNTCAVQYSVSSSDNKLIWI